MRDILKQSHFFHIVTPSPWPFLLSLHIFSFILCILMYLNFYEFSYNIIYFSIFNILYVLFLWFRDIMREATYEGMHSLIVQKNLKFGFSLFTVTEIMFFFGFFFAFFYLSLAPSVEIGCTWAPIGIPVIEAYKLPFLNTVLLLLSGIYITLSHIYIRLGDEIKVYIFILLTLICSSLFLGIQGYEYISSSFTIADGVYGSIFYMLTGFHGFHVLIGTLFIAICFILGQLGYYSSEHHVGFECAIWYWHFVDVVWLFLFIFVYVWGNIFIY